MSQRERLMCLFRNRPYEEIPLPEILRLGIAQYNARIKELREEGKDIQNWTEWVDGEKHSWFVYRPSEKQLNLV